VMGKCPPAKAVGASVSAPDCLTSSGEGPGHQATIPRQSKYPLCHSGWPGELGSSRPVGAVVSAGTQLSGSPDNSLPKASRTATSNGPDAPSVPSVVA
jgi:hypothetical protein